MKILSTGKSIVYRNREYKSSTEFDKKNILNAVDIVDSNINDNVKSSKTDNCLLTTLASIPLLGYLALCMKTLGNNKTTALGQVVIPSAALSALTFYIAAKQYGRSLEKSEEDGYRNAVVNELNNDYSFAELTKEQENIVNSNHELKVTSYRNFDETSDDILYFNPAELFNKNLEKNIPNEEDYKKSIENLYSDENLDNKVIKQNVNDVLSDIDTRACKYKKGIIQGINILTLVASIVGFGCTALIHHLHKNKKISNPAFVGIASFAALSPLLIPIAVDNSQQGFDKIARFKAKDDIRKELNGEKLKKLNNPLECLKDYLVNRKKYNSEIIKQKEMSYQINNLKSNLKYTDNQILNAKTIKKAFVESVEEKQKFDKLNKTKIKEQIAQNALINASLVPVLYLLCRKGKQYIKNAPLVSAAIACISALNIPFAEYLLNSNKRALFDKRSL